MTTNRSILLVRHGETDWNRQGRLQGFAPTPLNDRGREQTRQLGAAIASSYDVGRMVVSDLSRTRETAAILAECGLGADEATLEPSFDSAWRERDMGIYQGFTWAEFDERFPALTLSTGDIALEERPEGGESLAELYDRVAAAWQSLTEPSETTGDQETILVVTHGGPITVVLSQVTGIDLLRAMEQYNTPNCSLAEIAVPDGTIKRGPVQLFESEAVE